ncbi:glycosyl transferase, partial [Couchioplanes caeruleus subsp. azureus]
GLRLAPGGTAPGGTAPGGTAPGGTAPGGTAPGGTAPGAPSPGGAAPQDGGPRGGGMGGLLNAATVSDELKTLLDADADRYTWVAAAVGSQNASGYQLATQDPVMAIGGFNGSDPSPTLAQFQRYVAEKKIHYFVGGGSGGRGGSNSSSQIAEWVAANYTAETVGGVTLYDLTAP